MFDLSGMTALVTGAAAGSAARSQGAGGAGRAAGAVRVQCRASSRPSARSSAAIMSRWPATFPTAPRSTAGPAGGRGARGKLDILVNNAGVTRDNLAMRMKDEEWDEVIRINLEAAFRLMRAAAQADDEGALRPDHPITSVVGVTGNPGPGQLCRVQGRADRHVQGLRAGGRQPRDHRQLRRAGLHDVGDDRRAERRSSAKASCRESRWARWAAARTSARRCVYLASKEAGYVTARRCT